ncbi:uncharacterized protein TNCV_4850221 [Trichonephila clavipes]|nr:uncharacterized protein TNCV_4850221 [Trichonephila clavipes]
MENTHRRPSGKRPKKRRFRGNQFMKVCSHTYVAERRDTNKCASSNKISGIQTSLESNLIRSILAMRCIGQGLESLKTFCAVMSLPNLVEQKSYDVVNNKLSRVMKKVAEEIMKRASVEENTSSPDNVLTVSGDGTWKTRGNSSLIGVCTVIGAETDLSPPALLKKCLGGKTQNTNESLNSLIWKFCPKSIGSRLQIAEIAANLVTSVFNDGNQILISILEKFGLKINRNVCVSLAERDNRRIFTSRQRRLESSFEARRAKKIKKSKEIELFQEQEGISYDPGAF